MNDLEINLCSFSKIPLKKISWKTLIGFSWSKQPQRENGMRSIRTVVVVSPSINGRKLILNDKETLNPRAKN